MIFIHNSEIFNSYLNYFALDPTFRNDSFEIVALLKITIKQ